MEIAMKTEEEKSYAGLYLFLSFILTLTIAWAVWNEAVTKGHGNYINPGIMS